MVTGMRANNPTDGNRNPTDGNRTSGRNGSGWRRASWLAVLVTGAILAGCSSSVTAKLSPPAGSSNLTDLASVNVEGHSYPVTKSDPAVTTPAACGQTLVALSKTIGAVGSTPTAAWLHRNVGMVLDPAGGAPTALAAVQYMDTHTIDQSCTVATGAAEMLSLNVLASMPSAANQILTTPQTAKQCVWWTSQSHGRQTSGAAHCSTAHSSSASSYDVAEIFPSRWFVVAVTSA